ncbi:MAG: sugar transporter permease [Rhodocyclales bacterium]|nr:sugar transporter permease [Rhodocyclales bacterium]
MSKVIYTSTSEGFCWRYLTPWGIARNLLKHRALIASVTERDFRANYHASYLGVAWQIILPLIMLSIFYFVFGRILGGRFSSNVTETPVEYALALFVGLGFFNFIAQTITTSPSLVTGNVTYVKSMAFPLEVLSVTSVLNALLTLVIGLMLTLLILICLQRGPHWSVICMPFYVICSFLMALGVSWGLSALAVFIRDISAITSPTTLILMFMCPIFYPASMVPAKIKWIIRANPLAVIIEDARGSLLYGVWPHATSMATTIFVSLLICVTGYFVFMSTKSAFADVM